MSPKDLILQLLENEVSSRQYQMERARSQARQMGFIFSDVYYQDAIDRAEAAVRWIQEKP